MYTWFRIYRPLWDWAKTEGTSGMKPYQEWLYFTNKMLIWDLDSISGKDGISDDDIPGDECIKVIIEWKEKYDWQGCYEAYVHLVTITSCSYFATPAAIRQYNKTRNDTLTIQTHLQQACLKSFASVGCNVEHSPGISPTPQLLSGQRATQWRQIVSFNLPLKKKLAGTAQNKTFCVSISEEIVHNAAKEKDRN